MQILTVSSKGQVVIPARIRKKIGLKPQSKVLIKAVGKKAQVEVLAENPIEEAYGMLADWKKSTQQIKQEIRSEEAQYEKKKWEKLGI